MPFDYVVLGAGIVGLATAYHLKRLSPDARVLVVDKASSPGAGDTGKSAAAYRAFFTNRLNLALSKASIEFYESVQESGFDLGMRDVGYLFLLDEKLYRDVKEGLVEAERLGLPFDTLDPGVIEERLGIRTSVRDLEEAEILGLGDIVAGVLAKRAGIIAAEKLVEYYYNAARDMGVEFSFNTRVLELIPRPREPLGVEGEPFAWQDSRIAEVKTSRGTIEVRGKTIAALGAWTFKVLNPVGVEPYSRPKKRQVFAVKSDGLKRMLYARGLNRHGLSPMIVFPRKAYARPEPGEGGFWVGMSDDLGRPFMLDEDPAPEEDFYFYSLLPVLSLYKPEFHDATVTASWAGNYDISFDGLPIIFEAYESDLIVSCGTSGSGIMKADSIGRITASLALGMEEAELYDEEVVKTGWLGLEKRRVEQEKLII